MDEETKKIFAEIFAVIPHWTLWMGMVVVFVVGLWFILSYGAPENNYKKKIDAFFIHKAWVFFIIPGGIAFFLFVVFYFQCLKSVVKMICKLFG